MGFKRHSGGFYGSFTGISMDSGRIHGDLWKASGDFRGVPGPVNAGFKWGCRRVPDIWGLAGFQEIFEVGFEKRFREDSDGLRLQGFQDCSTSFRGVSGYSWRLKVLMGFEGHSGEFQESFRGFLGRVSGRFRWFKYGAGEFQVRLKGDQNLQEDSEGLNQFW